MEYQVKGMGDGIRVYLPLSETKIKKNEYMKRLIHGVYFGRNNSGWLMLIRLPLGYGLNVGTGFSGSWSIRTWEWAKYDYADHFSFTTKWRWLKYPEGGK
jgi:hypothetical protein